MVWKKCTLAKGLIEAVYCRVISNSSNNQFSMFPHISPVLVSFPSLSFPSAWCPCVLTSQGSPGGQYRSPQQTWLHQFILFFNQMPHLGPCHILFITWTNSWSPLCLPCLGRRWEPPGWGFPITSLLPLLHFCCLLAWIVSFWGGKCSVCSDFAQGITQWDLQWGTSVPRW